MDKKRDFNERYNALLAKLNHDDKPLNKLIKDDRKREECKNGER